jgi:hypothetical protein
MALTFVFLHFSNMFFNFRAILVKEVHLTNFTLSTPTRYVFVPQVAALYDDARINFNPFTGLDVISVYVTIGESTLLFPKKEITL